MEIDRIQGFGSFSKKGLACLFRAREVAAIRIRGWDAPSFYYLYSGDFRRAEEAGKVFFEKNRNLECMLFPPQPPLLSGDLDLAERRLVAGLELFPDEPLLVCLQGSAAARGGIRPGPRSSVCAERSTHHVPSATRITPTLRSPACMQVLGETDRAMAWLGTQCRHRFRPCWPFFRMQKSASRTPA